ncbi:MAG: hypothetical protein GY847_33950 [Proteobacteria bacterium]|nr:hypothetical protein [Pseudomonadota bacterium]
MTGDDFQRANLTHQIGEEDWYQLAKMAEMGLSAAAIFHEVRQPLSALKMALQLMREGGGDGADTRQCLSDALEQTDRLERLLAQMLSFLRPNLQERMTVDLALLVEGVLSLLTGDLQSKSVEIKFNYDSNLPYIIVEKHKIEQILFNLIVNARDAVLEVGGGRIIVLLAKGSNGGVGVIIADDGIGINPSLSDQIFEPFYSTKEKNQGTGLGLYIARRIAEQHNATLELLDEKERKALGKGKLATAFKLTFFETRQKSIVPPLANMSEHDDETDAVEFISPGTQQRDIFDESKPCEGVSVLLVEHDDNIRDKLCEILNRMGCTVKAFDLAKEANDHVRREGSDVLVARAEILKGNGDWFATDSGEMHVRSSVVIMDRSGVDKAVEAIHLGACGVFFPPFDDERIVIEFKRAVSWLIEEEVSTS